MSRFFNYLKPNFSRHWGNWILAPLIAFLIGFLPVDAFSAEVGQPCVYTGLYQSWHTYADSYAEMCASVQGHPNGPLAIDSTGTCRSLAENSSGQALTTLWPKNSTWGSEHCPMPTNNCPSEGSQSSISIPLHYGTSLPEYYVVNGCKFLIAGEITCEKYTDNTMENCTAQGEYTGEEATEGPTPTDPGDKPQKRCYRPDGSTTNLIDYDAPCPEGSTEEPPEPECDPAIIGDCDDDGTGEDPDDPDGGDGSECDPETEDCTQEPDCDPETEQCSDDPKQEGDPENGVADMGQTDMAQYCRDNPKAIQCAEYKKPEKDGEDDAKKKFDIEGLDAEIEKKWDELSDVMESTKSSIRSKLSLSISGGGGLPCFPMISWDGKVYTVCLSDHASSLSKIASVILFLCVVIGIFIILR